MDVRHTLICFFFLSLQDENTGLINAQITVYSRIEGGDITVKCSFSYSGSRKFFCREECNQNILIETTHDIYQSGRYSIVYTGGYLYVGITQLTKSDSGLYRCGSDTTQSTYKQIEIIVVDAKLNRNAPDVTTISERPGGNVVVGCFFTVYGNRKYFCKDECEEKDILVETTGDKVQSDRYSIEFIKGSPTGGYLYVNITQLTKSDSGLYRCGLGSTRLTRSSYKQIEIVVVDAMLDGNEEEVTTISERPGGNIVVECSFTDYENRKYICKDECEEKDILVETTGDKVQDDRYSIDFRKGSPTGGSLYVAITQLTKSDSGLYGCGLDIPLSPDPIRRFNIIVTDPTTSTPTSTQSDQPQTGTTPSTDVWLYVGLTLAVMVVLFALAVLIYCRKRSSEQKEPRGETEYASNTETNRVYEDVREDRNVAPMEISSVYAYAGFARRGADEDDCDAAASPQNTADSSKLTYSELNFPRRTAGSSNSAIRGDGDHVVYSDPRVEADAVYSTVS